MAVAEDERTEQDGSGARTALIAAAAAAATGAATLAARRALSHDDDDGGGDDDRSSRRDDGKDDSGSKQRSSGSMLSSVATSAWDSASDVVLPMADEAFAAAGRYLAESAPEIVRERLVPKFIEAFNEAS
jgi:hypothetical protein